MLVLMTVQLLIQNVAGALLELRGVCKHLEKFLFTPTLKFGGAVNLTSYIGICLGLVGTYSR